MKKTLKMIALLIMIVTFATGCSFNQSASAPKTTADGKVIIEPGSKDDPLNGAEIIMLTLFRGYAFPSKKDAKQEIDLLRGNDAALNEEMVAAYDDESGGFRDSVHGFHVYFDADTMAVARENARVAGKSVSRGNYGEYTPEFGWGNSNVVYWISGPECFDPVTGQVLEGRFTECVEFVNHDFMDSDVGGQFTLYYMPGALDFESGFVYSDNQ